MGALSTLQTLQRGLIWLCQCAHEKNQSITYQLKRIQQVAACIALVATGVVVATPGTGAFDEAVGQKGAMDLAERLRGDALLEPLVLPELQEDVLDDLGVVVGAGAAKVVELDLEVVVDLLVLFVELVTQLAGVTPSSNAL